MNAAERGAFLRSVQLYDEVTVALDDRTLDILDRRRRTATVHRRGWLVRRMLLAADVIGLSLAFLVAEVLFGPGRGTGNALSERTELLFFALTLPVWIVVAKLYALYDHDEESTDHTTVDDIVGVFHVVTVGAWLLIAGAWVTKLVIPNFDKLLVFWGAAIMLIIGGRAAARSLSRRHIAYLQNTVIVGAGDVGQLVARKLLQHSEYGINVVGFVDAEPKELREDLGNLRILGPPGRLESLVRLLDVERVIFAFSKEPHSETLELIRSLKDLSVQIDVVPRLFEIVGPSVEIHTVEGLPLVGLPPLRISRSSRAIKRTIDLVCAIVGLVVMAAFFVYAASRIKRESPGPVFFRQTRLGYDMRPFTALKFRTMRVDADDSTHRAFIKRSMDSRAAPEQEGIYKLKRDDVITPFGRWLRKTSLDELPQLFNVLRGEMSIVGPRPCIPYETENFAPHHFERFLVPAGMTGLWQVTARAHSTFGEALDMDVAYARGWSLGLDLWLMLKTPLQVLNGARGTA
jgi:exopolysaccharide biosynthesis polyprenyl glycosylphosphotransferase